MSYSGNRGQWRGNRTGWRPRGGYNRGSWKSGSTRTPSLPTAGPNNTSPAPNSVKVYQSQNDSPYKGWRLYFPQEDYSAFSLTVKKIETFEKYLISWEALFLEENVESRGFFEVDFQELVDDHVIKDGLPNLASDMREIPETVINSLGLAMHQMLYHNAKASLRGRDPPPLPVIHARIVNYGAIIPLKNLKANYYGKFVTVKGTVIRVSNVKPLCTRMMFECNSCLNTQTLVLPDGKYILPPKCISEDCKGRFFTPKRSSPMTETIDWQTIRIQEIIGGDQREAGRIPRTVDCELTNDLVDSSVPGDVVTISGVMKVSSADEGHKKNKDKCMFMLYMHANSVTNAKGKKKQHIKNKNAAIDTDFNALEQEAIEEIRKETNLFRLIVASICPSIYGHEMVKAGLILGVFGGTQKFPNDTNHIPVRGDPHILVVGDPGLGKSQMLQAVSNIAPRSVYVCGNTTTTSGLTVTLSKEGSGSGDYALEAGALVLADQGCCCIDEFDKMSNQHQALLEAMEQQSISIAKAGIVCSLPARTSILAAANPAGGHYNKAKTVSENLKMGSPLLSRFDLVFIMLDKPDEEMDSRLSEHVMALHSGKSHTINKVTVHRNIEAGESSQHDFESETSLSDRLKVTHNEVIDVIPPQLLRKYIGYARKYIHSKITPGAAQVLQEFYLDLRKRHQTQDSVPITTRQLESLIRLTEARARIELRKVATESDAKDVVDLMKYSMRDTYSDDLGVLDFQRSQMGSGMSSQSQAKRFIAALQRASEQTLNSLFTVQQMRQIAQESRIQVRDFDQFMSSLNNQGFLLKKGPRMYQLQTTGY